jgi:protein OS-9
MIKETSTCSYLMVIQTPRLCSDVAFLPPQENLAHPISCRPVIPEADVDEWTLQKLEGTIRESEQRLAELENENPLRDMEKGADGRSKKRPVIGGIEVGAQKWVGSEGKVLEKSAIVGGGPEKFIATIATSSGYQMTNEEMKKLGIKDPDDVVTWKNKLAKKSKNAWKLDLVDTARGPEFRWMEEEYEEEPNLDDKADKGQGGPKSNSRDQSNRKDGKGTRQGKQEEAESEEGSEEVFKDEL